MVSYYTPTGEDLEHIDGTIESTVTKSLMLNRDEPTQMLEGLGEKLLELSAGETFVNNYVDRFQNLLWDGHELARLNLTDNIVQQEVLDRFGPIVISGRYTTDFDISHSGLRNFMSLMDIGWVPLSKSLTPMITALVNAGSPDAYERMKLRPPSGTRYVLNGVSGDCMELRIKAALVKIAKFLATGHVIPYVIYDPETPVALGSNAITQAVAAEAGVNSRVLWPPESGTETPYTRIVEDDDPQLKALMWHYSRQNHNAYHDWIQDIGFGAWSEFRLAQDVQYTWDDYRNADLAVRWSTVGNCSTLPSMIGQRLAKARGARPQATLQDMAGPQLGWSTKYGGQHHLRPTSPDVYTAGCWTALAEGAKGFVSWGLETLLDPTTDKFTEEGRLTWNAVRDMQQDVVKPIEDTIMAWRSAKRRTAILFSKVNDAYESGCDGSRDKADGSRFLEHLLADKAAWLGLSFAGEPADFVVDSNPDSWKDYDVLVIPRLYVAKEGLLQSLYEYSGTIITHEKCVYQDSCRPLSMNLTKHYTTTAGAKDIDAYYHHWYELADNFRGLLPGGPTYDTSEQRLQVSKLTDGEKDYIVIVNHNFVPGPQSEWWEGLGGLPNKFGDQGVPITITNPTGLTLRNLHNSRPYAPDDLISISGGDGRVFEVIPDPPQPTPGYHVTLDLQIKGTVKVTTAEAEEVK